jgi:hypothetical protein
LIRVSMCLFAVATPPTVVAVAYFSGVDCIENCPAGYDAGDDADYDHGNNHSPNATMAAKARVKCACGFGVFLIGSCTAVALLSLLWVQGQVEAQLTATIKENEAKLKETEVNPFDEEGELMGG